MKKALVGFILFLAVGVGGIVLTLRSAVQPMPDILVINDTVMSAWQSVDKEEFVELLTQPLLQEYSRVDAARKSWGSNLLVLLSIYIGAIAVAGICLFIYCEQRVLRPFRRLQRFARDVASGNLDIPLEMDKQGNFGAFTESFDLMREELKRARENERAADRSKKELVASLSHDIKTPIASIKAATELMLISAKGEKERTQLERIEAKTEQIDTLITDLFHATLEELQALSVTVAEVPSTDIHRLVQNADYKGLVKPFRVPDCIIQADLVRLGQVLDNIIGNSYKYASTDISLRAEIEGAFLIIDIEDHGAGVPDDDLPLIRTKFYRGKNADEKSGYGLGLYISEFLMSNMSGELQCENREGGFAVILALKLAG